MIRRALLVLSFLLGVGCGGSQSSNLDSGELSRQAKRGARDSAPGGVPALAATRLAEVPAGTYGPYLGARPGSRVAIWAAPDEDQGRAWHTLAIGERGRRLGRPLRIAEAPAELGLVALRPAGGKKTGSELAAPGFVVVTTDPGADDEVKALALGPRGELRGGPTLLAQPDGNVLWVDAVETGRGSLALWAVRRGDRADLFVAELGGAGQIRGEARRLVTDVVAWQAGRVNDGAAVATVQAGREPGGRGPVQVLFVDGTGAPVGDVVTVSSEPTAGLDLDLAPVGSGLVVAWSDRRQVEPKLYAAALDARGGLRHPPARVTRGLGEETLIQIVRPVGAAGPAYLAWERVGTRAAGARVIHLAPIAADGRVGKARAEVWLSSDDSVPEFGATADGVAALTVAPACPREQTCKEPATVATFVQFDSKLDVVASEPLRLDVLDGSAPSLSWGLQCGKAGCVTLAALASNPAPVYAVRLEARSPVWQPAGRRSLPEPVPRAVLLESVAELDPVHDVSVLPVGESTLVAWVTYFDPTTPYRRLKTPAPDGRLDPLRALLQVRAAVGKPGELAPSETISLRARSLAGVELVPGRPGQDEALLVWSAIDQKQPQVFLTLLDSRGKKKRQKMLTHTRGEVSDVAAASVGDAWLVAWVDESSGDPEVYVTRVDQRLVRAAKVEQLTHAPGAATGIAMRPAGEHTQVVWADARDPKRPGYADIFAVRVSNQDGKAVGAAQALAETAAHSFFPVLDAFGDGLALGWLETSGADASQGQASGIRLAQLDEKGHVVAPPELVQTDGGRPTSLAMDCVEQQCRVVVGVETDTGCELHAMLWTPGVRPKPRKLAALSGPAGQSVAPALHDRQLFFADQTSEGQGRVRRMFIDWTE